MRTNLKRTLSYEDIYCNQFDQVLLLKICIKLIITIKHFLTFAVPLNWPAIIDYRSARARTFYSNDMIWLHQVTVPLHQGTVPLFGLHQIPSNDMTKNCISPKIHNWCMYQTWEIETPNLVFKQMVSQGSVGGQTILLILAAMCFCSTNCGQFVII